MNKKVIYVHTNEHMDTVIFAHINEYMNTVIYAHIQYLEIYNM